MWRSFGWRDANDRNGSKPDIAGTYLSHGRGPLGALATARPALRACICACWVNRIDRAHMTTARLSRSRMASSLSSRCRPPSSRSQSSLNASTNAVRRSAETTWRQKAFSIGSWTRSNQLPGIVATVSRQTCASFPFRSWGGGGLRGSGKMGVEAIEAADLGPRFVIVDARKSGRF